MNKPRGIIFIYVLCILSIGLLCSCRKETLPPTVATTEVKGITQTSASCGGEIIDDGGAKITEKGLCWSTSPIPSINDYSVEVDTKESTFSCFISELTPFTTYFIRAYATNKHGTSYGATKMFTTQEVPGETVSDIDSNLYHSIKIGNQIWTVENLKTTKFRNGDTIENIEPFFLWDVITPAYCNYNNDESLGATYGRLYNWYAVSDSRGLAPEGWHIPSRAEWQTLVDYCGGEATAGTFLKEAGFVHWQSPNLGATNESGFTALPAGRRTNDGSFDDMEYRTLFWSMTDFLLTSAYFKSLDYNYTHVMDNYTSKQYGMSIRCIKD